MAQNRTHACNVPSPRWDVTCSVFGLQGGGLYIWGTATLTNSNVYSNQASDVSSPFELSMSFHPSPH